MERILADMDSFELVNPIVNTSLASTKGKDSQKRVKVDLEISMQIL